MINPVARWMVEVTFIVARSFTSDVYNTMKHTPHQTINQSVCRVMQRTYCTRKIKINQISQVEIAHLLSVTSAFALDRESIDSNNL